MRTLRASVTWGFPALGLCLVIGGVWGATDRGTVLAIVLTGILLIIAGIWGLENPLLPTERRFLELRAEVDGFVQKVRTLNRAAYEARTTDSEEAWDLYQEVLREMHDSVERMGRLAGDESEKGVAMPPSGVG